MESLNLSRLALCLHGAAQAVWTVVVHNFISFHALEMILWRITPRGLCFYLHDLRCLHPMCAYETNDCSIRQTHMRWVQAYVYWHVGHSRSFEGHSTLLQFWCKHIVLIVYEDA
jgi:hypothetical protein